MIVYLVTNICPKYRVKLFELLATFHRMRFLFFSESRLEKYWERNNPVDLGRFDGSYVQAVTVPGTSFRFVPSLYKQLAFDRYDVLIKCINGKMPLLLSFLIARVRRIPFVLWTELWQHPQTVVHRLSFPLLRWVYRTADAVVVPGTHVERYLLHVGVPKERIFVGWQAVDNEHFSKRVSGDELLQLRQTLGVGPAKVVLYVGRLEDQKGVEYLLRALPHVAQRTPVMFVAIGTGSKLPAFERVLEHAGFRQYRLLGFVASNLLPMYYQLADVLVLPSITTKDFKEPWGLVINEAMNQGCPVVATDAVGAAVGGLVHHGVTGLVVPERDVSALGDALTMILVDDALREQMRANAYKEIKRWDYRRMAGGFTAAINYAIKRPMAGRSRMEGNVA